MASLQVDCWEEAALRSRLRGDTAPLRAMLDFIFKAAVAAPTPAFAGRHAITRRD